MTIKEAINCRKSRRTFTSKLINETVMKQLEVLMEEVNKESGLSFKIVANGADGFDGFKSYGLFKNVCTVLVFKGNKDIENLYEKVGYYGERIVLEVTQLGLASCWVGGTFKNAAGWQNENEEIACVVPIGYTEEKLDLKEKLMNTVSHVKHKSLDKLCTYDKPETWFIEAMEAVQQAPSAMNRQPVYFKLEQGNVTVELMAENKYAQIDLGIAKYHFEVIGQCRFSLGSPATSKREVR
ncbi:MAG: nitroreductase family protein [Anaerorhabdus sp.]